MPHVKAYHRNRPLTYIDVGSRMFDGMKIHENYTEMPYWMDLLQMKHGDKEEEFHFYNSLEGHGWKYNSMDDYKGDEVEAYERQYEDQRYVITHDHGDKTLRFILFNNDEEPQEFEEIQFDDNEDAEKFALIYIEQEIVDQYTTFGDNS